MQGQVFKRNATWSYVVDLPVGADGKRRQRKKGGFRTRKLAEAGLASLLADAQRGIVSDPSRLTVAEFLADYLEGVASSAEENTYLLYDGTVRRHVLPRIGGMKLTAVTTPVLQRLYGDLSADGVGARTVRVVHQILNTSLARAADPSWNLLPRNPAAGRLTLPRYSPKAIQTWSPEQARLFLEHLSATGHRWHGAFALMLAAGLRRGEVLGLRWQDIDLEGGRASIVQTVVQIQGRSIVKRPKTERATRTVSLRPEVVALLRRRRVEQLEDRMLAGSAWRPEEGDEGLVFTTSVGTRIAPRNFLREFQKLAEAVGLPKLRAHELRHTAATIALSLGTHPKFVADLLGHARVAITLDTYSHVLENMHERATDDIGGALFGDATGTAR